MVSTKLPKIAYGGDYNPDQWPADVWREDIRLFRSAGIDIATLPVFSWAQIQPNETTYNFGWLDEILALLADNNVFVCMATSTAAMPAWLARRYPEVLRVNWRGLKQKYGRRHNFCPNSPVYRTYSRKLALILAERYGSYPGLLVWHVNNEYGGACYCEKCAAAFRVWLQERYASIEEVNKRWNTRFWSHTFYDWDDIVPPNALSEGGATPKTTFFPSMSLDYSRFMSDSLLACYRNEREVLKKVTPAIPVTTNFMGAYWSLDYFSWAPYLDIAAWDSYPRESGEPSRIAFCHDLMRALKKGNPFMLMEQSPNQVNWEEYSQSLRPGRMRLWSYQAVAHGADTVMFFQLRRSRGGAEKFHGAVIDHCGHENTRVFAEAAKLGKELAVLGDATLNARKRARVALLFDWENWWALTYANGPSKDLDYVALAMKWYSAFWGQNIPVDIVHPSYVLDDYRILVTPAAYLLQPGFAEKVKRFVYKGGTLVTTFFSGIVDENDNVTLGGYPGELREALGVWVEELDALPPEKSNRIRITTNATSLQGDYTCGLLCEMVHTEGAEEIGVFGDDFYAGMPAVTRNAFGRGHAWYVATDPEVRMLDDLIAHFSAAYGIDRNLSPVEGVEVTQRTKNGADITFILNHSAEAKSVDLGGLAGTDLLTGKKMEGVIEIAGRDVCIIRA